ncbi:DUF1648 domain-containing protein [Streptomyces sp. NPDC059639]|uniref:DUF1648 domain-containing protein n=1 Tax=Streptomyces sp. NPDC059639 TaxID=3346891 RepID=UPI00369B2937
MTPSRATRTPRALLAGLPFAAAALVATVVHTSLRDRLPDPMATHFPGSGPPDGFSSAKSFLVVGLLMLIGTGMLFAVVAARQRVGAARWTVVLGWATAGLLGSVSVSVLRVNAVVGDAHDARMSWWHLVVAFGIGAVAGGAGWLITRGWPRTWEVGEGTAGGASLALREGERAVWVRQAGSWPLALIAAALIVAGLVVTALVSRWGLVVAGAGLGSLVFGRVQVTVGPRGLVVAQSLLSWPRVRIPLEQVESASRRTISPLGDFGGWGYRIRPGASGVVLRAGEALVVRRSGGREFAVTVDDAGTAAALLNSLVARKGSPC